MTRRQNREKKEREKRERNERRKQRTATTKKQYGVTQRYRKAQDRKTEVQRQT